MPWHRCADLSNSGSIDRVGSIFYLLMYVEKVCFWILLFVGEISFANNYNNYTSSSICAIKTQHADVLLPYIFDFICRLFQMTIYILKKNIVIRQSIIR